ncbi:hypothetical protein D5086_018845 [Populus alba]|uniref:Uncharacterized protein n=1 Tax=Populus alba TaxID=43335 RepID=A0ACC4BRK8_POPAL
MKLRSLSLDDRLRTAVNVAWCLNYLHNERAIPHGNLKPTNILLEPPNMNPLLTDYSLHRILTSASTAEQVLNAEAFLPWQVEARVQDSYSHEDTRPGQQKPTRVSEARVCTSQRGPLAYGTQLGEAY